MTTVYGAGKVCPVENPSCNLETEGLTLEPGLTEIISKPTEHSYSELAYVWQGWRNANARCSWLAFSRDATQYVIFWAMFTFPITLLTIGCLLMVLSFGPNRIIGRLQEGWLCEWVPECCLDIEVLGIDSSGSVNNTAVASTVRSIRNPDWGRPVEYTDRTTAPLRPVVRRATSAWTTGFYKMYNGASWQYFIS